MKVIGGGIAATLSARSVISVLSSVTWRTTALFSSRAFQ